MEAKEAIREYLNTRRASGELSRSALVQRRYILTRFATVYGRGDLQKVSEKHVVKWLDTRSHLAPSTLRIELSAVKNWLSWCARRGWCTAGVADGIRGPRQPATIPRAYPPADVAAALAACETRRDEVVILLMVQSGLRCMEVAGLRVDDIDLPSRVMRVRGKGNKTRLAPIPDELADAISDYLAFCPARAGAPLVRSFIRERQGLLPGTISKRVTSILYAAGVKYQGGDGRTSHAMRHTAACDVAAQPGVDVRDVADFLGHSNLSTTQIYLRRARATERLNVIAEGRTYGRTA